MAFEVQELPDIIRVIVLLSLTRDSTLDKNSLKHQIDNYCKGQFCVDLNDVDRALKEMSHEGLIEEEQGKIRLTQRGRALGREWQNLLLKKEPILEVVAGLTDGSITGLVVVISAFLANLEARIAVFAAVLTLSAVAITNFSSFLLGGKTEDIADLLTLKTLMDYSLSDIPDESERDKSLLLIKELFILLHKEIGKSNLFAAIISGATTFLAGSLPIIAYLTLPRPFNIVLSLTIVSLVVSVFLVRYRSARSKVHWKVTLTETVIIIVIAVIASLIIGAV